MVLAKAGTWMVGSLMRIADFLNWKKFIVTALLMGLVSSMPEFFVGVSASLAGRPELSFGTVLGANLFLLTLVVGVAVLLGGKIKLRGKTIQRSLFFTALYALLPLFLILDGEVSRSDGIILIIALVFYIQELILAQKRFKKTFLGEEEEEEKERVAKQLKRFLKDVGLFLLGLGLMVVAAQVIVFFAHRLAIHFNLPLVMVGALIIALGTSLPELSFGIRSAIMKQKEMVLGVVFGSVVINSTLILGTTSLISPFRIHDNTLLYFGVFIATIIIVSIFFIFSKTGDQITRREAKILLFLYFLFFIFQLW